MPRKQIEKAREQGKKENCVNSHAKIAMSIQNRFKTDSNQIQKRFKTDSKQIQNRFKTDSKQIQNGFKTDSNRFKTDSNQIQTGFKKDSKRILVQSEPNKWTDPFNTYTVNFINKSNNNSAIYKQN